MHKLRWFIVWRDEKDYEARAEIVDALTPDAFANAARIAYERLVIVFEEQQNA